MTYKQITLLKTGVFLLALGPFLLLLLRGWNDALGANPIETITNTTGIWTLRFLAITLAITPLRRLNTHPFPSHAGTVYFFLRQSAFSNLRLA